MQTQAEKLRQKTALAQPMPIDGTPDSEPEQEQLHPDTASDPAPEPAPEPEVGQQAREAG